MHDHKCLASYTTQSSMSNNRSSVICCKAINSITVTSAVGAYGSVVEVREGRGGGGGGVTKVKIWESGKNLV